MTTRRDVAREPGENDRRCSSCGRIFKNEHGVRIHQGKTKCKEQLQQRKAPDMSEYVSSVCQSVEDQSQQAQHSALDLSAHSAQSTKRGGETEGWKDFERKPHLNLPPATDCRWAQLDEDLGIILDNTLKGDAIRKIRTMVEVVYQVCHDTFNVKESNSVKPMEVLYIT